MTKGMVKIELSTLDINDVYAKNVVDQLQKLIDTHSPNEISLKMGYSEYGDDSMAVIYLNRPETDSEKHVRELEDQKRDARQVFYAKIQYEELKKRFG